MPLRDKKITINKKLRPIRLAFLIKKDDNRALREAFRINTCLWGGIYNPIIPFFKKTPTNWEDRRFRHPPASSIIKGYLDSFDPDYLVVKDKNKISNSLFDKERLLSFDDILNVKDDEPISFGVDITDVYWHLYDKDFKFERRHPIDIFCPKPSQEITLLSAYSFGDFPNAGEMGYIKKNYSHYFSAKELSIDKSNFFECFLNKGVSPLRITRAELKASPRGWRADASIFFMDATSWLDIVDYWNLRAVGRDVLPLPKQYADHYIDLINGIIKHNYVPYRHNKDMMHHTTFICSRSSTMDEMQIFTKKLTSPGRGALSLQHWYPRMWDEWAKGKDHVELCSVVGKEEAEEIFLDDDYVRFKDISPSFADRYGGGGKPRWINTLKLKDFYKRYDCPSVLPRNLKDAYRLFGAHSFHKAWVSSEGINIPCEHYEWSHFFEIPSSLKVFEVWFKEQGYDLELSGAGRILLKIVDSVGGIHGARAFQNEEIVKLLNDMSHAAVETEIEDSTEEEIKSKVRAKTVPVKTWQDLLQKISLGNSPDIAERRLKNLLNDKILRGGITLQCPECAQRTWYALDSLSDRVTCERCLEKFDFPIVTPISKASWHLRTIGPFAVENYAQGGYCVALSLEFFGGHGLSNEMTWIPSFILKTKGEKPLEADFGIFLSEGRIDEIKAPLVIFGECKSFNEFTDADVRRMGKLASEFPGAIIAFCTLRNALTKREKKIIANLARKGRKHFKAEQWINPVLILTGIELFADFEPPSCYKDKGAPYEAFANDWHIRDGIQNLSNATQQMHLEIESYWTWYEQERQKKLQKKRNCNKKA